MKPNKKQMKKKTTQDLAVDEIKVIKDLVEAISVAENMADNLNAYEHDCDDQLDFMADAKRAGRKLLRELKKQNK